MRHIITAAAVATLTIGLLAGCTPHREATEPPAAPAPAAPSESTLSDEETARLVATAMDPVFGDDATWEAGLEVARSFCALADSTDRDTALGLMEIQGIEYGVSADQVGILASVGAQLYCPAYRF